ncbi:hypothetical protein C8A00DRAFT_45544 [Chaetomidium leptoderma]|uniref:Uncharacterized protein n=1 Tax=Chaetomidium leptoderma TaxID=669021 RepID=A0AAN6ZWA2_9PEZI|nr:hypothetical protein C8A00DRAFT_45544 [Chaetomidium leptoderma]
MPPKRAAAAGPSQAKKSRPSTDATDATDGTNGAGSTDAADPLVQVPRNKRWSARATRNPLTAYNFVCMCQVPFTEDDEEYDEDDEENEETEESGVEKRTKRVECDGGEKCLCDKPASEHPNHPWKFSYAGKRKFLTQVNLFRLRCPDYFDMYTFNDHEGYGVLEMLQNLMLDFEEAAGNYKEQWAVCEGLALFLATANADSAGRIDCGDTVDATYVMIGRLFMSMLAQLEREKLLSRDSEIKNLGLIMAQFMDFARGSRDYGLLEESKKEALGPAKDKKKWEPHAFDNQILAYARKYGIDLVGPSNIDKIVGDANADVDLPAPESNTGKADPFGFAKSLKKYKTEEGGITAFITGNNSITTPIGGDSLDITTWTSAKRKSKAFDKKDPISKELMAGIKNEGLVVGITRR